MNDIHDKGTCQSPVDRKLQANVTFDVEWLVRIVPPLVVKYFFQNITRNVLQHRGKKKRSCKQDQQIFFQRCQDGHHNHHAAPIDRTVRTIQKSTVHELSGIECSVGYLGTPTDKCIDNKNPDQFIKILRHNHSPLFRAFSTYS